MKKTIQRESLRIPTQTLDVIGKDHVHRQMAARMISAMPIKMLQKFMPLKLGGEGQDLSLEIRIEI